LQAASPSPKVTSPSPSASHAQELMCVDAPDSTSGIAVSIAGWRVPSGTAHAGKEERAVQTLVRNLGHEDCIFGSVCGLRAWPWYISVDLLCCRHASPCFRSPPLALLFGGHSSFHAASTAACRRACCCSSGQATRCVSWKVGGAGKWACA